MRPLAAILPSVPFWQTFLTSSGFGALTALLAAGVAYAGIRFRAERDIYIAEAKSERDRKATVESDSLQRWWDVAMWLWENYPRLSLDARLTVLESLEDSMVHRAHGGILSALTEVVLQEFEEVE